MSIGFQEILTALLTGALPTLIWLWFWLSEDSAKPEPKLILVLVFVIGALSVLVAIPLQQLAATLFQSTISLPYIVSSAAIEEVLKFGLVGLFLALTPFADEPIDYAIYFITGALGFAALENTLYLADPILQIFTADTVTISSLRFLGSTLLHAVMGAILGLGLGLVWKKSRTTRVGMFLGALFLVTALHSAFNHFILHSSTHAVFGILATLWVVAILLLYAFERIKRIHS